jgi:hypothetical protein
MNSDISGLLSAWPYDPDQTIRIVTAEGGRGVLQVRLPLGLEQYEIEGRPDGVKPRGFESFLEEIESRLEAHIRQEKTDKDFSISHEDFLLLQGEGVLYYYRYLLLFQINDFERVARDTGHNLRICSLVEKYVASGEDRVSLLQFKPYIIRMNSVSRSMLLLQRNEKNRAQATIQEAMEYIRELPEMESPAFQFEKIRSLNYLKSALKQIEDRTDNSAEDVKRELELAIQEENYERAAELRDRLKELS